jgi:2-polyprenyl-6-methoxyphenol hydroxylase-like FAD-dependent oxidoreductase
MLQQIGQSSEKKLNAEVCIAGAGPAGISLALTLARLGISSVLLEAGPMESPSSEQRDPYKGGNSGLPYPLTRSRLRYFGGTSNHWGGWCKPLDPVDFSRRASAPLPSWPLGPEDLEPHYPAALEWCEIPEVSFDPATSVADPDKELLFRADSSFTTRIFRFSPPTRFGDRYGAEIGESDQVHCICRAALLSLGHDGRRITHAIAGSLDGERLEVHADHFVLAMGGIEVTRFLLHLADSAGTSFGMQSGLLGACFMDHFGFHPGYLAARPGLRHHRHAHDDEAIMPVLTASEDLQQQLDLPSICLMATPDAPSEQLPPAYFYNAGIIGAGAEETGRYRLQLICEPTAHSASRVLLGNERDAFGMRRVDLRWDLLDEDYQKVEEFLRRFERAVGQAGLGRVQRTRRFEGEARSRLSVGMHHMGTTRMADDPAFGVVDPNCRVFGSDNLFIASSSVFPRVGYTNPTLAIIALVDRLARHLAAGAG